MAAMTLKGTTKRFQIFNEEGVQVGNGAVHKGMITMYGENHKVRKPFTTFEEALNEFVART